MQRAAWNGGSGGCNRCILLCTARTVAAWVAAAVGLPTQMLHARRMHHDYTFATALRAAAACCVAHPDVGAEAAAETLRDHPVPARKQVPEEHRPKHLPIIRLPAWVVPACASQSHLA